MPDNPNLFARKLNKIHSIFLSHRSKERFERLIILLSLCSFLLHLGILMTQYQLSTSLIGALYTPFTIILLYEVYLLVYYLKRSMTEYIGKQYEIITLILIRSVFEDISYRKFDFSVFGDQTITFIVKLGGIALLFLLVFVFYQMSGKGSTEYPASANMKKHVTQYMYIKKVVSLLLIFIFVGLLIYSAIYSFGDIHSIEEIFVILKKLNLTFYNLFFTTLILSEVFLLLFIMYVTDQFSIVIRNSSFIISTTLLKISFSYTGIAFTGMVLLAVLFGVVMLGIYRLYDKKCLRNI